jgi:hypothetical protein
MIPSATSRSALIAAVALVIFAALWRVAEIEGNFSPVAAIALFAGAAFADRRWAYGLPLLAMALSDLYLGLHSLLPVVYGCMMLTTWLGTRIGAKARWLPILGYGFLSSLIFFVVTNFAVWLGGTMYPMNAAGLLACFTFAVPFFKSTVASTVLFSVAMFGVWQLVRGLNREPAAA